MEYLFFDVIKGFFNKMVLVFYIHLKVKKAKNSLPKN